MATLKETYSNSTALFTACPPPASPNLATIESLIWGRWAPYELCIDDKDAWEEWFKYLIVENWGRAEALFKSADLIEDPLKSFWKSTDTTGTIADTDTIRIENNREEAHATSGYNNSNNEGHIWIRIQNEGDKDYVVKKGDAMIQGMFVKYLKTDDDIESENSRDGGFGSTNKKEG